MTPIEPFADQAFTDAANGISSCGTASATWNSLVNFLEGTEVSDQEIAEYVERGDVRAIITNDIKLLGFDPSFFTFGATTVQQVDRELMYLDTKVSAPAPLMHALFAVWEHLVNCERHEVNASGIHPDDDPDSQLIIHAHPGAVI